MTDFDIKPVEGGISYISKKCRSCGLLKDVEDFHKDPSSSDGHRSTCKICFNRGRRTNRTIEDDSSQSDDLSPMEYSPTASYNSPRTDRTYNGERFGTELTLVIPTDYKMRDTKQCPCCHNYNVMFECTLEGDGMAHPFLCCNDCILKSSFANMRFFLDSAILFIVRDTDISL